MDPLLSAAVHQFSMDGWMDGRTDGEQPLNIGYNSVALACVRRVCLVWLPPTLFSLSTVHHTITNADGAGARCVLRATEAYISVFSRQCAASTAAAPRAAPPPPLTAR